MTTWRVDHGDCLDLLRAMPDASVDAVVTDPPYGLSFMGKKWDYDVPSVEVWAECLRVLKPGGHLLAFAGTRTQHRMAVRIEDAGFEIRDMIAWVYSTGFPKSHNFGCKCRGVPLSYAHEEVPGKQAAKRPVRSVCKLDVSSALDTGQGRGEVLQSGVSEQSAPAQGQTVCVAQHDRPRQSCVEGRRDVLSEAGELQAGQVREMPQRLLSNGEEGRIHYGASSDRGANDGAVPDADGGGASQEPRSAGQQAGEPRAVPGQRNAQANRVGACESCGGLVDWKGWGTALKPAMEMVTMARKPLIGTVAANVMQHGTGAVNVDGCRVGTDGGTTKGNPPKGASNGVYGHGINGACDIVPLNAGRWPANLIHDGSDEVLAGFPGDRPGMSSGGQGRRDASMFGVGGISKPEHFRGDSGSAARFFYCPKASKADREAGLEDMPSIHRPNGNKWTDQDYRVSSGERPPSAESGPRSNPHPTVKPTALMQYLCRLVTPPGGTVLDPFTGSGSTGKAAMLEGFNFIGFEREAEYVEIARRRIAEAAARPMLEGIK